MGGIQEVNLLDSEIVNAIIWKLKPGVDLKRHLPRFYKEEEPDKFVEVPAGTKLNSIPYVPLFLAITDLAGFAT
ncbi:hypothetical protein FRB95_000284 [Tulasnella sp. JGI-2019a]|nr:hypothetical protein FRB95_000284 [Tulasnella sp. JGI-2019a]